MRANRHRNGGVLGRASCALLLLLAIPARASLAQVTSTGGETLERAREAQLVHGTSTDGFLLRSMSSMWRQTVSDSGSWSLHAVAPQLLTTVNSAVPFSLNDGALWAGRGASALVRAGVVARWKSVELWLVPEFTWSQNLAYPTADPVQFPPVHSLANPRLFNVPAGRSPFASPFHPPQQSIDLPIRFGDKPLKQFWPGQTTLAVTGTHVTAGASTENEWWGPGRQNALLLSDNAPGFPHLFLRTSSPIKGSLGSIEARWLVGGLTESAFFDSNEQNDLRSISIAAIALQPAFEPNLTFGLARSVFAPASGWGDAIGSFYQLFSDVGAPDAKLLADTTTRPGRDQLTSLFLRWVFPADGLEVYTEWGRAELPTSLRDFFLFPNHTQAYVTGLQWLGSPATQFHGRVHLYGELAYLEQSSTYRYRPMGSWYTSRAVGQGYTNHGQVLGAAIGPGSDSQLFGIDVVAPTWRFGVFLNRVRWMEDVHSQRVYNPLLAQGVCEHDVSFLPGVRSSATSRYGQVSVAFSSGWRRNTFFENAAPYCFLDLGRNYRNKGLTVTFDPSWH